MRFVWFGVLFFLMSVELRSQTLIQGRITDLKGGGVPGASISIKGSYDGATADSTGRFQFTTTEKGEHWFIITALGYKTWEMPLDITGSGKEINVSLKEVVNELKAVIITAGSFAAGDAKRGTVLNSIDVATTAGALADVSSAMKTLPGAQQVGENEGLFVRGGTASETQVFIDGTRVNNFFYSGAPDIATRGRFSPFLFKGTVFSTGGYSALYGQGLSSALILESIDLPEQTSTSLGVSTVGVNAGYQHLSRDKKSSWGASYGYFNLWPYFQLVQQQPDYFEAPKVHNGEANFRIKTRSNGMIKFYTSLGYNRLGLRNPDIDNEEYKDAFRLNNTNVYTNLSWREKLGNGWRMDMGLSYSYNHDSIRQSIQNQENRDIYFNTPPYASKIFRNDSKSFLTQAKIVMERKFNGLNAIRFGGEFQHSLDKIDFANPYVGFIHLELKDNYKAAFVETDIYITNALAAKLGGRLEHTSILEKVNVAPRISLAYKLNAGSQLSMAYGIFYQKPEKSYLYFPQNLEYQKASHFILNYQKITNGRVLRTELFYKPYSRLVKTYPDTSSNGDGYAKGVELFWRDKKTFKNIDYWISYSYLDTKRDYLNYPTSLTPNFAARHTASLVMKKFVTKWKTGFNATYTYASGRPYYRFAYEATLNKYVIADQGKTIDYHNLSFSLNYIPTLGKERAKSFIVWVLSASNVFGFDQVYGYNYSADGSIKQPIIPPASRFIFLGCFISFGVDRTQDAINNNL